MKGFVKGETAEFLRQYNAWRRGADAPQPEPKAIGEAIDRAVELIDLLCEWMPVIEAHVEASHLTDGFRRKKNGYDALLEKTKAALK